MMIFVFGSNLMGIHGKGAALTAKTQHGAIQGRGYGPQGNSFAIPTKFSPSVPMGLGDIKKYVNSFIHYACNNPEEYFYVTAIGTGLAGYSDEEIGPMFENAPSNCYLPLQWLKFYKEDRLECFDGK